MLFKTWRKNRTRQTSGVSGYFELFIGYVEKDFGSQFEGHCVVQYQELGRTGSQGLGNTVFLSM